jgi:hypothetical protein
MMSGSWDAMIDKMRSKLAVSEVLGVVLLLGITISLFVVLNLFVFSSFSFHQSGPFVSLTGTIDKTNTVINIKHNGGESLEGTTNIIITIGTTVNQRTISEIINHTNSNTTWKLLVSSTDKNPDKWDFGETVQFNFKDIDITDKYIQVTVVDPIKNTILVSIVLQQGSGG